MDVWGRCQLLLCHSCFLTHCTKAKSKLFEHLASLVYIATHRDQRQEARGRQELGFDSRRRFPRQTHH